MGSWKMVLAKARLLQCLLLLAPVAATAEEVAGEQLTADAAFLEYLGSWQENDADWIVASEWDDEIEEQEASVEQLREDDEQGG